MPEGSSAFKYSPGQWVKATVIAAILACLISAFSYHVVIGVPPLFPAWNLQHDIDRITDGSSGFERDFCFVMSLPQAFPLAFSGYLTMVAYREGHEEPARRASRTGAAIAGVITLGWIALIYHGNNPPHYLGQHFYFLAAWGPSIQLTLLLLLAPSAARFMAKCRSGGEDIPTSP